MPTGRSDEDPDSSIAVINAENFEPINYEEIRLKDED